MNKKADTTTPLHQIAETVELLHNSSNQLIAIMDQQIDAIIASNAEEIEHLSDAHAAVSRQFKTYETAFISELGNMLGTSQEKIFRLMDLKKLYPESGIEIDQWQKLLSGNTRMLQKKHDQVMQLLEFAMSQNARMMHNMYSLHNEKNAHYAANGDRSGMMTGVAVNQEV